MPTLELEEDYEDIEDYLEREEITLDDFVHELGFKSPKQYFAESYRQLTREEEGYFTPPEESLLTRIETAIAEGLRWLFG